MLRNNRVFVLQSRVLFSALLMGAACGAASAAGPAGENWHHDWNSAWKESQSQGRPMLFFVTMDHCYYCEKMNRETYCNNQVLQEIERDYVLATIDSSRDPSLVRKLNVRKFPTTVIVSPEAKVVDSMTGYVGPEQLRSRLKTAGARTVRR